MSYLPLTTIQTVPSWAHRTAQLGLGPFSRTKPTTCFILRRPVTVPWPAWIKFINRGGGAAACCFARSLGREDWKLLLLALFFFILIWERDEQRKEIGGRFGFGFDLVICYISHLSSFTASLSPS